METQYPLVLVFYIDAEVLKNREIITPFVESVNDMIAKKESNVMAFFLPTTGEERIECINPVTLKETDMYKINKLIEDIRINFSIGTEMPEFDEDIILDEPKPCVCGNNEGGSCQCE
jgi:hypothetical protein